jgi:hypothetical protein
MPLTRTLDDPGRIGSARSGELTILQALVIAVAMSAAPAAAGTPPPVTPYEASGGRRTPRYDETDLLAAGSRGRVTRCSSTRPSARVPEGRPLPLVVADLRGRFTAERRSPTAAPSIAVVLVQACIHAGESCGKDAGMLLLRDLAADPALADRLLERVTLLFIPIFNVDGHERFSAWGRINQNGPEEMGWRVNAANLNLNRDYLKADTVEMRAWLAMWRAWLPDFFIDVHSTDGADYQYALTYSLETHGNLEAGLTAWTRRYEEDLKDALAAQGWPIFPYVMLKDWADPTSGLVTSAATPRFSQGYVALQNRPGLLVEAHMLKDYATRVEVVGRLLRHSLGWLSGQAKPLRAAVAAADAFTAGPQFRAAPLALDFALTDSVRTVDFLGVGASEQVGAVTGGRWFRFDGGPQVLPMALQDQLAPSVRARLPEAYLLPPAWGEAIERLEAHGVVSFRLSEPVTLSGPLLAPARSQVAGAPQRRPSPGEVQRRGIRRDAHVPGGHRRGGPGAARRPRGGPPAGPAGPGRPGPVGLLRRGLRAGGVRGILCHRGDDPAPAGREPRMGGRVGGAESRLAGVCGRSVGDPPVVLHAHALVGRPGRGPSGGVPRRQVAGRRAARTSMIHGGVI